MTTITHIPLTDIDDHAMIRDRSHLDQTALAELTASIRANGLRLPVEVMAVEVMAAEGVAGDPPYALLSGLRCITAFRALAAEGGPDAIPALIRPPTSRAEALAAVIEENEIREPLSAWERGRVIHIAHEEALFDTIEAAAEALFPAAV